MNHCWCCHHTEPTADPIDLQQEDESLTDYEKECLDADIHEILPNRLYLCNGFASKLLGVFEARNIHRVLNCTKLCWTNHFEDHEDYLVQYLRIPIFDDLQEDLSLYYESSFEFIESTPKEEAVLAHCAAGASRSASFVIAYLMRKMGKTYDEAFAFVKERRDCIQPNESFERQLREYEQELREKGIVS